MLIAFEIFYFDENNKKFYDKNLVKNVIEATGIIDRPVTAIDYINYLNSVSSRTGGSTFKQRGGLLLEEVEVVTETTPREKLLNNTDYDTYFDYVFGDGDVFATSESIAKSTLAVSLPFTAEGNVFKIEESKSEYDNDALKIINPDTGAEFILTVGKDGEALRELPQF